MRTVAGLASLVEATDEAVADLAGQRETARARALQVGPETGPGELRDALTAAETHRRALREALDQLYPDRPGAEFRRDLAKLKGTLEANVARMAEDAKPEQSGRRRHGFAGNH